MKDLCWLCKTRRPERAYEFREGQEDVCSGCFDVLVWFIEGRDQRKQEDLRNELVRRGLITDKK